MAKNNLKMNSSQTQAHHYARAMVAGFFGFLAALLIILSILVVWLNRTLTDTTTYVETVGPLIEKPEVQSFIAQTISDQIMQSASTQVIASVVLPPQEIAGKSPQQLQTATESSIRNTVGNLLRSTRMQALWVQTNRDVHASVLRQLDSNSGQLTLDLGPFMQGVVDALKSSSLAPLADKIQLDTTDVGQVQLTGGILPQAHRYYEDFKRATVVLVIVTLALLALTVYVSVHHLRTLRRMLVFTGVTTLLIAGAIYSPHVWGASAVQGADPVQAKAAIVIAETLLRNLFVASLVISLTSFVLALGSKLYSVQFAKKH